MLACERKGRRVQDRPHDEGDKAMTDVHEEVLTLRQREGAVLLMTFRGDW